MTPKIIADFESSLETAIIIGSTTFTLSSATDDDRVTLPAGLYYFTVDNGSSQKEYLAGTLSGTAVTAVVSVSRQGVETSGAVRAHRVGASVILTDFATYSKYMNAIALVSAPDASAIAKGVVEMATQTETDAGTSVGGTGARLAVGADTIRAGNYNDYVVDTGVANAYVITPSPVITAYATGQFFTFKAVNANTTTTPTVNVNGAGVKTIKKQGASALASGDIGANSVVIIVYDGTDFQLVSTVTSVAPTTQTFLASGTYTKPANVVRVFIQMWGAGGSGAAGIATVEMGGGGGGGYFEKMLLNSEVAATVAVTIGTGASAAVGGVNNNGSQGGVSSWGTQFHAYGGGGGSFDDPGKGGGGGSYFSAGGNAVTLTTGTAGSPNGQTYLGGGNGGDGVNFNTGNLGGSTTYGGGGGGGGGSAGAAAGGVSVFGGNGGTAQFGATGNATSGSVPGGGGGAKHGAAGNSGAGANGKIVVTEYYS